MDAFPKPIPAANEECEFLRSVMLFHDVPDYDLQALAPLIHFREFAPGELILRMGDPSTELCIVQEGTVSVYLERGKEKVVLTNLGEGAYFGELAVFDDYPRSASVEAMTKVRICVIDQRTFRAFLQVHPAILFQMCKVFSHRLRNTNSILTKR